MAFAPGRASCAPAQQGSSLEGAIIAKTPRAYVVMSCKPIPIGFHHMLHIVKRGLVKII